MQVPSDETKPSDDFFSQDKIMIMVAYLTLHRASLHSTHSIMQLEISATFELLF
jgi:hypothetical protein